jgi:hypothetical protein
MSEDQWLTSTESNQMVIWVWDRLSERKARLLACAACRRVGHLLQDPRVVAALDLTERYAEGGASAADLETAHREAAKAQRAQRRKALLFAYAAVVDASHAWSKRAGALGSALGAMEESIQAEVLETDPKLPPYSLKSRMPAAFAPLADLVRHVVGNTFLKPTRTKRWSPVLVQLAQDLYSNGGAPKAVALHAALLTAKQTELAEHFQGPEHPKGCWALDLLLEKN